MTEESKKRMEELEDAMVQHWRENFKTTADGYGLKRYGFKRGYEAGMQDPDANAEKISKLELESKVLKEAFVYSDRPFRKLLLKNADLFECFDEDIYESEMKDEFGASDVTGTRIFEFRFLKENSLKLQKEIKRLKEALDFALPELERLNCDAPISLSIHTGQVLINIKKALSSGGE